MQAAGIGVIVRDSAGRVIGFIVVWEREREREDGAG